MKIDISQGSDTERLSEDTRAMLVRYLLGELDDEEKGRIEERYFSDDDFYTQLLLIEDELIDFYVLDELPRRDQAKFVDAYVNDPHRFKKVQSNRVLLETITERLRVETSVYQRLKNVLSRLFSGWNIAPRYSLASLCVVAIFCGGLAWLIVDRRRISGDLQQARAQWQEKENNYQRQIAELQPRPNEIEKPSPRPVSNVGEQSGTPEEHTASGEGPPQRRRSAPPVIAFALSSSVIRTLGGGSVKPLVIPRGTVLVSLKVDVEKNDFQTYDVSLQAAGSEVWRQPLSKAAASVSETQLEINLPASVFVNGTYSLKVTASHPGSKEEILALHPIRVINRNRSEKN